MRMFAILDDTISHYTSENRGYTEDDGCVYENDQGFKCAVGRLLNQRDLNKVRELNLMYNVSVTKLYKVFKSHSAEFTSPKIIGLPVAFLADLQILHDHCSNWDTNGLIGGRSAAVWIENKIFDQNSIYYKGSSVI
jgi:hypothetical protein